MVALSLLGCTGNNQPPNHNRRTGIEPELVLERGFGDHADSAAGEHDQQVEERVEDGDVEVVDSTSATVRP